MTTGDEMLYSCCDLTRKKRFVVEGGKLPGLTAVQLTRSVLCSSMMLTLPGEFSGMTEVNCFKLDAEMLEVDLLARFSRKFATA